MLATKDRDEIEMYMLGKLRECPILELLRKAYMELIRVEDLDRRCKENPTRNEERN